MILNGISYARSSMASNIVAPQAYFPNVRLAPDCIGKQTSMLIAKTDFS
jgi:hypothetical protein